MVCCYCLTKKCCKQMKKSDNEEDDDNDKSAPLLKGSESYCIHVITKILALEIS